jgi:DNA-binding GntR family transcriptional regulator
MVRREGAREVKHREHLAIIESVAAGNLTEASTRMRAHLEQAFVSTQTAAR